MHSIGIFELHYVMVFGYLRSVDSEELKQQKLLLSELGCEKVFVEKMPKQLGREFFDSMLREIRVGDALLVPSVYVIPLTMIELVSFLAKLTGGGIMFKSVREPQFQKLDIFPVLDAYQKRTKGERAMANLTSQKPGRKRAGRPKGLSDEAKKEVHAVAQLYKLKYTVDQIMVELSMTSRSQVYKRLREAKIKPSRRKQ